MLKVLKKHWDGEVGPLKSFFVYFLGSYLVPVLLILALQTIIHAYVGLVIIVLCMTWGAVGSVRALSFGLVRSDDPPLRKGIYALLLLVIGGVLTVTLNDLSKLL